MLASRPAHVTIAQPWIFAISLSMIIFSTFLFSSTEPPPFNAMPLASAAASPRLLSVTADAISSSISCLSPPDASTQAMYRFILWDTQASPLAWNPSLHDGDANAVAGNIKSVSVTKVRIVAPQYGVGQHPVEDLRRPHWVSSAPTVCQVWRAIHVLRAAATAMSISLAICLAGVTTALQSTDR
jgi:hypothetical protein